MQSGIYDQNDYYCASRGTRLSSLFEPLLSLTDCLKATWFVAKLPRKGGAILDIGAGDGKFLHFVQRRGYEVAGTTASSKSQQAARERYGIEIAYSVSIPHSLKVRKYLGITYWHVFEHLEDPHAHLKEVAELLEPNGILAMEVPNFHSLGARLAFGSWLGSDPIHHINRMSRQEIVDNLTAVGLEVLSVGGFSFKFSFVYLWSALLGKLFGSKYDFDFIMTLLKSPLGSLRKHPVASLNALAALGYLAPVIATLVWVGLWRHEGEVIRIVASRKKGLLDR